jgi:hypothetical protein
MAQRDHRLDGAWPPARPFCCVDPFPTIVQGLPIHLQFKYVQRLRERVKPGNPEVILAGQGSGDVLALHLTCCGPVQSDHAPVLERLLAHGRTRDVT